MFPNPLNTNSQSVFNNSNGGNPPNKKVLLLGGGGLVLVLIMLALLLFSGGGNKNSKAWQDLVNNETQILVISGKYGQYLTDQNLKNATAITTITWQSNNKDVEKIYSTNLGKAATPPSQAIYKSLETDLNSAKTAGNLDSVFTLALLKQLNLVKSNTQELNTNDLGPNTKTQLDSTHKLADSTIKLLQPFAGSSASNDTNTN